MPRRHPDSRAQQGAPKRCPGEGAPRRRDPLLPGWPLCEPRPAAGAGRPEGWRARGGSEWWQASGGECPLRSPPPGVPPLPRAALRAARRSGLRALLLPPRFLDRAPWTRVSLCPEPGGHGKDRRGAAREAKDSQDSLGALLGQFLPSRFQKFLRELGAQWVEQLERQTASEPERSHQRGVSDHWWGQPPPCPSRSFLPDLRCQSSNLQNNLRKVSSQSSNLQNNLRKVSSHQIPILGPLRRDCTQFTEARKANNPCGLQAPKLKAALNRSSAALRGEAASGHNRRCSPFRVRFADETLQDTAFRYWERRCARSVFVSTYCVQFQDTAGPKRSYRESPKDQDLHQPRGGPSPAPRGSQELQIEAVILPNLWLFDGEAKAPKTDDTAAKRRSQRGPATVGIQGKEAPGERVPFQQGINKNRPARPAPSSDSLEPVFGSIRRWLESLPNTLDSKHQKRATTSARAGPGLPNLGRQSHLSEDTLSSSTQRWRRDHKAFPGTQDILDQVGKSPCSWSQKLESLLPRLELKRGGPRGYQLLLPSALQ